MRGMYIMGNRHWNDPKIYMRMEHHILPYTCTSHVSLSTLVTLRASFDVLLITLPFTTCSAPPTLSDVPPSQASTYSNPSRTPLLRLDTVPTA
jgi:hypothetical protein